MYNYKYYRYKVKNNAYDTIERIYLIEDYRGYTNTIRYQLRNYHTNKLNSFGEYEIYRACPFLENRMTLLGKKISIEAITTKSYYPHRMKIAVCIYSNDVSIETSHVSVDKLTPISQL